MPSVFRKRRVLAAWGVHVYTMLGLPLNFLSLQTLFDGPAAFPLFCLYQYIAVVIDATDGTFARKVDVKKVVPQFDGAMLDNIVDFLTFAFLPAAGLYYFDVIPSKLVCMIPMMASGYQFCQSVAKTPESFVGFPSYWNILVIYLVILKPHLWTSVFWIALFSVLVFVPIHYIYPSKAKFLRWWNLGGGAAWAVVVFVATYFFWVGQVETSKMILWWSMIYPVYYFLASLHLTYLIHRKGYYDVAKKAN
eukprot:TRINITY_DN342_c3_g1_i1.p1 TRINITY_DN342_c3_g1~~TRINITY_DN342_c3_g1_i1.p1  ORF type:complete len:249 (-),score=49.28 TRINITY_DN342_c3_g1_i1:167-913(-)